MKLSKSIKQLLLLAAFLTFLQQQQVQCRSTESTGSGGEKVNEERLVREKIESAINGGNLNDCVQVSVFGVLQCAGDLIELPKPGK